MRLVLDWDGQRVEADVETGRAAPAGSKVFFELPRDRLWEIPSDGTI